MELAEIEKRRMVTEQDHVKQTEWLKVRDPILCMYVTVAMVTETYMVLFCMYICIILLIQT